MMQNATVAAKVDSNKSGVWQFFSDGAWHVGMNTNDHKKNTEDDGHAVRDLYCLNDDQVIIDSQKIRELVLAAQAALEYIDAIPDDVELPAMPGFDRDWYEVVLDDASRSVVEFNARHR